MHKEIRGRLNGQDMCFGIVVSHFNELITKNLLAGALDALQRHGVKSCDITTVWVPGAFEIPLAAQQMARTKKYDAIICLGAVIRGSTAHFDFVAGQAASGIARISLDFGLPVIFGVTTPDTIEQAIERAGCKAGNKGYDSAVAAIEMIDIMKRINSEEPCHSMSNLATKLPL